MKKWCFISIVIMFFVDGTIVNAKNPDDAKIEQQENNCDLSDTMEFQFNDQNKTTFAIPRVYFGSKLLESSNKKPTKWVVVKMHEETLLPSCKRYDDKISSDYHYVQIEHSSRDHMAAMLASRQRYADTFIRSENGFSLYRDKKKIEEKAWVHVKDLLVPLDPNLKNRIFLDCAKGANPSSIEDRAGCRVVSLYRESFRLTYVIHSSQLSEYLQKDKRIKEKLDSFIVSPRPTEEVKGG